jgi:hypothetical protein
MLLNGTEVELLTDGTPVQFQQPHARCEQYKMYLS